MVEYLHPELRDLSRELSDKELSEIAATCIEDYKADEESRQEWLSLHADWLRLYFQKDTPINPPWEGASTESIPMLAEACNQFHARAYQAMFPGRDFIKAVPVGKWDAAAAERGKRVGTHMSYQLLVKDRQYKRSKDRLLLALPLHGSAFTKTYYDPIKKRSVVENVRATDFVVAYGTGPRNLEDIQTKTEILWKTVDETKFAERDGFFRKHAMPYAMGNDNEVDQVVNEIQGLQESTVRDKGLCKIIEQHRLLDLDDDGYGEPYIVWIDMETEEVLRIAIRWDTDELGDPTDNRNPVEYYTHYPFLENPDGFYALGYGHLVGPLNTAVNKILRQTIDAGTLNNVLSMSGFIDKRLGIGKGQLEFQLGKFVPINASGEDISKGIWQPRATEPSQALLSIMELIMAKSDRLATVTEALTGQTENVHQPTALMALIEQGLQVFSSVYERTLHAWGMELEKLYRLNRKHMDEEEYYSILDAGGGLQQEGVARADYEANHQIIPVADSRQVTKQQKMAQADMMLRTVMESGYVALDPTFVATYNVLKKYLEEMGVDYVDEILPTPEELAGAMGTVAVATRDAMVAQNTQGEVPGAPMDGGGPRPGAGNKGAS